MKKYYDSVILSDYNYNKLLEMANNSENLIKDRAEVLAKEIVEERADKIEITIYHDQSDTEASVYISPTNQISNELEPIASQVKYWAEEIFTENRFHVSRMKDQVTVLEKSNLTWRLIAIALIIGLVLSIVIR